MHFPKISVIVPFHNDEKTIKRCIESVLNQNFGDFELILVNDGSDDCSQNICEEFIKKDSRVKLFYQPKSGVSAARNKGLKESIGEYICFLDADDEYVLNAFTIVEDIICANDVDMVIGCAKEKKRNNTIDLKAFPDINDRRVLYEGKDLDLLRRWTMDRNFKEKYNFHKKNMMLSSGFRIGSPWAKFIKRKSIQKVFFDIGLEYSEDLIFSYRILNSLNNVIICNDILYIYHFNDNSITHIRYDPNRIKSNLVLVSILFKIKNDYDVFFEQSIYKRIVQCYWDSIVSGIPLDYSKKDGIKKIKFLASNKNYKFSFKNIKIRSCKSSKDMIITVLVRLHMYAVIFFMRRFFSRRKKAN